MQGTELVLSEIDLPDMKAQICESDWPREAVHHAFHDEHGIYYFLPPFNFDVIGSFGKKIGKSSVKMSRIFYVPADLDFYSVGVGGRSRSICLRFSRERFETLLGRSADWAPDELAKGLDLAKSSLEPLMLRIGDEVAAPGFASGLMIEALSTTAIIEIVRNTKGPARPAPKPHELPARVLKLVHERVMATETPIPRIGELADLSDMSARNLLRLFKSSTGETLADYVNRARFGRACTLLKHSRLSLKEIAFQLGFSSHSSFSVAFRREARMSPSEFRQEAGCMPMRAIAPPERPVKGNFTRSLQAS